MIYKAIIEEQINESEYKIRIPRIHGLNDKSSNIKYQSLPIATMCSLPGITVKAFPGDIVVVSLDNDDMNNPIILGFLNANNLVDRVSANVIELAVSSNATLPASTNIGDIDKSNIYTLNHIESNIQNQIDDIKQEIDNLSKIKDPDISGYILSDKNSGGYEVVYRLN